MATISAAHLAEPLGLAAFLVIKKSPAVTHSGRWETPPDKLAYLR